MLSVEARNVGSLATHSCLGWALMNLPLASDHNLLPFGSTRRMGATASTLPRATPLRTPWNAVLRILEAAESRGLKTWCVVSYRPEARGNRTSEARDIASGPSGRGDHASPQKTPGGAPTDV